MSWLSELTVIGIYFCGDPVFVTKLNKDDFLNYELFTYIQ